jgi:hypothetical protein
MSDPVPNYGRNFNDPFIPRQPPVDDSQFDILTHHQGVYYERTPEQDQRLIREADGSFDNAFVWHSMASEEQWNSIQASLSPHSWLANARHGRQPGIELPPAKDSRLCPERDLRCVNIHLSQPLQSYWEVLQTAVETKTDYLEACFPAQTVVPSPDCKCADKSEIKDGDDDHQRDQMCVCTREFYPFLDALVGNSEGRLQPDRVR